ncbi:MAG: aminoglycoside phosphotransferase family protein [Bryobacterales bacterium]|nr:aminoglycoside phosphotransferase family protein [Bryobacterales bacterium]
MAEPRELSANSALGFLDGRLEVTPAASTRLLAGGVSNTVVLVQDGDQRIVLKQALPRLRVRDEWLADRSRVLREWEVINALGAVLPRGRLPELLFCDEANFLYAMRAAPTDSADWKAMLLAGQCDRATARRAGAVLGLMARATWAEPAFARRFSDRTAFNQLRTDPYYGTIAERHPDLARRLEQWTADSAGRKVAMVHGDWSPKNLLVSGAGIMCIDFECAHFGDPSYDAGFLLNHLILKAFHRPAIAGSYLGLARTAFCWTLAILPPSALSWFEAASVRHLAFLMLARIDGKSPVEYLDEGQRAAVRRLSRSLIDAEPRSLRATLEHTERALERLAP